VLRGAHSSEEIDGKRNGLAHGSIVIAPKLYLDTCELLTRSTEELGTILDASFCAAVRMDMKYGFESV
jgi:hypothetical protein